MLDQRLIGGTSCEHCSGAEPSGIGSVCLLLGEFSSPNPSCSQCGFALLLL